MAPRSPYKVHSLIKDFVNTEKGLTAEAQRSKSFTKPVISRKDMFGGNNDDNDDDVSETSSDSDSSDEEEGPGLLQKVAAQAKRTAKLISDEEIADSDDERKSATTKNASNQKKQVIGREKSASEGSGSDSESESSSESEPGLASPTSKVQTNGVSPKSTAASTSASTSASGSKDDETEDDSSDEDVGPKKAAPVKREHSASASDESSEEESGSESEEESESNEEVTSRSKEAPSGPPGKASTVNDSSGEDSDEEDEETDATTAGSHVQSTSARHTSISEEADESMHMADREQGDQVALPSYIAPDFVLRKGDASANGQDVARLCNQANMEGKQVWYFTVPANVPISVVQNMEIPMDRSGRGDGVFSHRGADYGVSFDSMTPKSSIKILIPSADGTRYQSASRQVDQVMQIKRIARLGAEIASSSSPGPKPKSAARPQPKGLKARYQPFGVNTPMGRMGDDDDDDSPDIREDTEMEDVSVRATPSAPAITKGDNAKRTKQRDESDAAAPRKGKRKLTSEDEAAAAEEQLRDENVSAKNKSKSKSKKQRIEGDATEFKSSAAESTAGKKTKLIIPPAIPSPRGAAVTSVTPTESTVKSKPGAEVSKTPVPIPRQTSVPIPFIPGSSQAPKISPVPLPQPPQPPQASAPVASAVNKKSKKRKDKAGIQATPQTPQPSAQANKSTMGRVTPVPAPQFNSTA